MRNFTEYYTENKFPMPELNSRPYTPAGDKALNSKIKNEMRHVSNFINEKMQWQKILQN